MAITRFEERRRFSSAQLFQPAVSLFHFGLSLGWREFSFETLALG
jgi:hypothetical protein